MKSTKPTMAVLPEGSYEAIVASCGTVTSTAGKNGIKFDFFIRSDVDQAVKGKHIFKSFYEDDNGVMPEAKIGEVAYSCGIEKGEDFEPWQLMNKTLIIVVKHFTPEDTNETKAYVAYTRRSKIKPKELESSDFTDVPASDTPFDAEGAFEVKPEDIPF